MTRVKGEIQPLETDEERDEDLAHEWEYARDPTFQERDDMWTGSNILVLTRGHVYGTELLYDVDKRKYYLDDGEIRTGINLIYIQRLSEYGSIFMMEIGGRSLRIR